jgi:hypothetical protein
MAKRDFENQGELIVNKPVIHWSPFDRRIADDERLSIEARGVLCWIGTRPDDHRLFVRYLQLRCGLSQSRWQKLRKELEALGYLQVSKKRIKGKFCWEYRVNLVFNDHRPVTIGGFSTDGKITDAKPSNIEDIFSTSYLT